MRWASITSGVIDRMRPRPEDDGVSTSQELAMTTILISPFLRLAFVADAIASGATGLLMFAGASPLAGLLGLPEMLLRGAGLILLPYAAIIAIIGLRKSVPKLAVWTVITANALWAIESFGLLAVGWVSPNMLGTAFVLLQAMVVAGLAGAQVIGLRRCREGAVAIA
jgi:hypothetical protein